MPIRRPTLPGEIFGRLTVIGTADPKVKKDGRKAHRCSCRCSCGGEVVVWESHLRNGNTKSCGCLAREQGSKWKGTHGHRSRAQYSQTYNCWAGMKQRCTNPKVRNFDIYGGRGINVCERWMNSFDNFLADMGEAPPGMSIDRIRGDRDYEPGNCRWADADTQQRNKTNNRRVVIKGVNLTVAEASRKLGISGAAISNRANRLGISYQEATNYYAINGALTRRPKLRQQQGSCLNRSGI